MQGGKDGRQCAAVTIKRSALLSMTKPRPSPTRIIEAVTTSRRPMTSPGFAERLGGVVRSDRHRAFDKVKPGGSLYGAANATMSALFAKLTTLGATNTAMRLSSEMPEGVAAATTVQVLARIK